jgi:hypothetical protein
MVWVDPGLPAGQGSAAYQEKGAVSDRPRNGGSRFWRTGPMFRSRSGSASSPCSDRRLTAVLNPYRRRPNHESAWSGILLRSGSLIVIFAAVAGLGLTPRAPKRRFRLRHSSFFGWLEKIIGLCRRRPPNDCGDECESHSCHQIPQFLNPKSVGADHVDSPTRILQSTFVAVVR